LDPPDLADEISDRPPLLLHLGFDVESALVDGVDLVCRLLVSGGA
jgi:hypothetical protein